MYRQSWWEKLFWKFVTPIWVVFSAIIITILMGIVLIYLISAIAQLIGA